MTLINKGIFDLQNSKRQDSIDRVKWAMQFIRDTEGTHSNPTAVKIANVAGLSRAVLYKPHLRRLWDSSWAYNPEENKVINEVEELQRIKQKLDDSNAQLHLQLEKSQHVNASLARELENEKNRSKVYRQDFESLKAQHQKLLHYNLRLLRKLHLYGVDAKEFGEEE